MNVRAALTAKMMNIVKFDVMVGDRFIDTYRMPITLDVIVDYIGDRPVISGDAMKKFIEKKRPTLKYEDYKIFFCE